MGNNRAMRTTTPTSKQMKIRSRLTIAALVAALAGLSMAADCGDDPPPPDASPPLQWYRTCGDVVCSSYMPTPGATVCSTQSEGGTCTQDGDSCEIPDDGCNADLLCTTGDPATNCPISQARFKRDIRYLQPDERERILEHLLGTRLATYRYRRESDAAPRRLGFIIDDQPDSPAVLPSGERVDLYGYTSMAVAAIQAQAVQIEELRAEIAQLRRQLAEK